MRTNLCLTLILGLLTTLASCTSPQDRAAEEEVVPLTTGELADSLQYFRRNFLQTDILSRNIPELGREQAFDIQLEMLEGELAGGARLAGWKMGGTAVPDSSSFDPVFGFILDRYMIGPDSVLDSGHFPGGSVMVEGEIGFVIKNDLPEGVASKEELLDQIDHVVGAVELAKSTAVPSGDTTLNLNYVIASGMGQVGTIKGPVEVPPREFDFEKETVKCYVNDNLAAEGVASNIFGNPLNALFELANLLPAHDQYLRAGDMVITGSLYQNPSIDGPADVRLEFSSLGTISFKSQ